ncbi:MAG: tRNA lysidine(34) synthetase TilS, partial [Rickettsiella sp.]|nr:tRNA lysidine(34) synthetase TilS [Rickettsiella sp.]
VTQYPESTRFWLAYSGGLDSQVLLHSLSNLLPTFRLKAVHINHGWHSDAAQWAETSIRTCDQLGIACEVITVDAQPKKGESPEAYARQARYKAMAKLIQTEDCLLTAHHRDDQAETLLLQLLRGAGLRGLASMPFSTSFGKGTLVRPLLNFTRLELQAYAEAHRLTWIEDCSNRNLRFDRNFVRHQVIPLLQKRWPGLSKTLARVAENTAEAHLLLEEFAFADWLNVKDPVSNNIIVSRLLHLTPARRRNCLRYWLNKLGFPLPSQMQLQQIELLLESNIDANPQVNWGGIQVRRYHDLLHIVESKQKHTHPTLPISWDLTKALTLPNGSHLTVERVMGQGIACEKLKEKPIMLSFRQGGERFHVHDRLGSHPLKKLFQEWGVPPWLRQNIPLIYCDNELIAVVGYGISTNYIAQWDEWGYIINLNKETNYKTACAVV